MLEFYIHSLAGIAFDVGFTSLGHSVTCTFLSSPISQQRCFWNRIYFYSAKSAHGFMP